MSDIDFSPTPWSFHLSFFSISSEVHPQSQRGKLNGFEKTPVLIWLASLHSTGHDWLNIEYVAPNEGWADWTDDDLFSNLSLLFLD